MCDVESASFLLLLWLAGGANEIYPVITKGSFKISSSVLYAAKVGLKTRCGINMSCGNQNPLRLCVCVFLLGPKWTWHLLAAFVPSPSN